MNLRASKKAQRIWSSNNHGKTSNSWNLYIIHIFAPWELLLPVQNWKWCSKEKINVRHLPCCDLASSLILTSALRDKHASPYAQKSLCDELVHGVLTARRQVWASHLHSNLDEGSWSSLIYPIPLPREQEEAPWWLWPMWVFQACCRRHCHEEPALDLAAPVLIPPLPARGQHTAHAHAPTCLCHPWDSWRKSEDLTPSLIIAETLTAEGSHIIF